MKAAARPKPVKKAASKPPAAKKVNPKKKREPAASGALVLPQGIWPKSVVLVTYAEKDNPDADPGSCGMYTGVVRSLGASEIQVIFTYPSEDGSMVSADSTINLQTGFDESFEMKVSRIERSSKTVKQIDAERKKASKSKAKSKPAEDESGGEDGEEVFADYDF